MNVSQPIASQIGSVNFGFLFREEIKALSVKEIVNPETFDSLLHPVPSGLYDLALGAWSDYICTTCNLNRNSCPGHPGHIELPVPVYHASFMDQLLKLLRAKCAYCSHFRLPRTEINRYICKLQLLSYGLVNESQEIETINVCAFSTGEAAEEQDDDEEDQNEDLIERRNQFVKWAIKRAVGKRSTTPAVINKVHATAEERRLLIKEFFTAINRPGGICPSCKGISHNFRKDGYNKIFRLPLSGKKREKMLQMGKQFVNHLVVELETREAKKNERIERLRDRTVDEGIVADIDDEPEDTEMVDVDSDVAHGNMLDDSASVNSERDFASTIAEVRTQQYVNPEEAHAVLAALFEKEQEILSLVYTSSVTYLHQPVVNAEMFFIRTLCVPPNRYRPEAKAAGAITEAQQNTLYKDILRQCESLNRIRQELQGVVKPEFRKRDFIDFQNVWVELQNAVNSLLDTDRNLTRNRGNLLPEGIKQKLEKKEGLFRKNMMGKRVNFAARSVISPDPNIETNEIGVPPVFAKKLTYPEPVTNHNFYDLKEAVLNGPNKWPGAAAIENENGQVINLRNKSFDERQALANQLLAPSSTNVTGARNKKVHRHLNNGDIVIMNRQPTLHKPSMMCHRARVLPGEKTIRMHYANCNTYNADFDGDEMNMHFPQNEVARAEALQIADTDHQYLVATSGKPLRGLIQDHISIGVWLSSKDTMFSRSEYQQLLYSCLRPESGHILTDRIETIPPAIVKPRKLWTGKQVVTTILKNITASDLPGLTLIGQSQTPGDRWGEKSEEGEGLFHEIWGDEKAEEGQVLFRSGDFISGVLDKAHLGPTNGGFIHSIYEAYGHTIAGKLLSILGRLLTKLLHMRAFSCGMEDIVLTETGDQIRREKLKAAEILGLEIAAKYVTLDDVPASNDPELRTRLEDVLRDDQKQAGLDSVYNARTATLSSNITRACLPFGLRKDFPLNQMQTMTTSGAKGSSVNANLISCNLGQQVLEGRRVPLMVSGKSLPSFKPYETKVRAGGYVTDRFLSGVKPQEYFFHAMAGREGLIDTAVKTSRSGYLQRCLIKGMEGLKVEYDTSVRDFDGSMVQFLYGEDGLDVTKQKHLMDFKFLAENYLSIVDQLNVQEAYSKIHSPEADEWNKEALKQVKKTGRIDAMDPVLAIFNPGSTLGSVSERFATALKNYTRTNEHKLFKDKRIAPNAQLSRSSFTLLMGMKYMKSVIDPGEAVGIVAGQSIGEPSTQMTLNTFHLAGHSTKNVTLGIPRLREIVMTASANISTPSMTLHLNPETSREDGQKFAKGISKLTLAEVVDSIVVSEKIAKGTGYARAKIYYVRLDLFPCHEYEETYAIHVADVLKTIEKKFIPILSKLIRKDLKSKGSSLPEIGKSTKKADDKDQTASNRKGEEDIETAEKAAEHDRAHADVNSEDEDDPDDDATQFKQKNRGAAAYDAPDDGEEEIEQQARAGSLEPEDVPEEAGMEDEGYGGSPRAGSVEGKSDDEEGSDTTRTAAKEREDRVITEHKDLTHFSWDDKGAAWCELSFEYDVATAKILMLNHVEAACREAVIQFIPGLKVCTYVEEKDKTPYIITEGVNLTAMRDYQHVIDPTRMLTNDIAAMLTLYGVEAARATIIQEIHAVFQGHSISVDNRHLNLIADVMTRGGGFSPFNRMGMKGGVSPFMKMSFETTVGFLKDAVLDGDWDDLTGPSARIVMGKVGKVGTGAFDVLMPVDDMPIDDMPIDDMHVDDMDCT